MTESKISKKSPTNKGSTTKVSKTKNDKSSKISAKTGRTVHDDNVTSKTSDYVGVTALIAIMEPATESHEFSRKKLPLVSHPSNKIKVGIRWRPQFPTKRNRQTLSLLEKAGAKVLAYFKWELPNKWKG